MKINLELAKSIVSSFLVNTKQHPEFLEDLGELGSKICKRNYMIGLVLEAIDNLKKEL